MNEEGGRGRVAHRFQHFKSFVHRISLLYNISNDDDKTMIAVHHRLLL